MRRLRDIMTKRVVSVQMDDTLRVIRELFQKARFHHVMVLEDDVLRGVISDRDLLKNLSPFIDSPAEDRKDLSTLERRAHQIMSRQPITATSNTTVHEAAQLLVQRNISCLPVVDDGALVGVVTWKDLLRAEIAEFH